MKIIGVIPARYKSSRFPGKPLADICGKPMIWWVYNQCRKVEELEELYVATDDTKIYDVCCMYDIPVLMTSDQHKTGTDRICEVATRIEGDVFVNIQGDEPLIDPEEIREVIACFEDESIDVATLKQELTCDEDIMSVTNVKIVTDKYGNALYMSRSPIPSNVKDGKLCKTFRHIGIYGFTRSFLADFSVMEQSGLELGEGVELMRAIENGYKVRVNETKYNSIGVDLPEHIALVENVIKSRMEIV